MKKILYFLVFLVLASCTNLKQVSIQEISSPRLKNMKGTNFTLEMDVKVDNPSGHKLLIKSADLNLLLNGYTFAVVGLQEKVIFPKKSIGTQTVLLDVSVKDVLALVAGGSSLISTKPDLSAFSLTGTIKAGNRLFSKKYVLNNVSFEELRQIKFYNKE